MPAFDERVRPSDVLREAARLIAVDGWDPDQGVIVYKPPRNGRFYSGASIINAIIRAYDCVRAGWYTMVRAGQALQQTLSARCAAEVKAWERAAGRTQEQIERALLRAAYRFDAGQVRA